MENITMIYDANNMVWNVNRKGHTKSFDRKSDALNYYRQNRLATFYAKVTMDLADEILTYNKTGEEAAIAVMNRIKKQAPELPNAVISEMVMEAIRAYNKRK